MISPTRHRGQITRAAGPGVAMLYVGCLPPVAEDPIAACGTFAHYILRLYMFDPSSPVRIRGNLCSGPPEVVRRLYPRPGVAYVDVTDLDAVAVVRHILELHGPDTEILFGPDMWLGAFVEEQTGKKMRVWTGECHVHAALRPDDVQRMRDERPDADMLIHPECGCTTAVMEYLSHGDIDPENTHMLSTGGMLTHAASSDAKEFIVATETGMLHPLEEANPSNEFIPLYRKAVCQYMKMITLPKVRDALLDETGAYEVKVPEEIAAKARIPIERMVSITP